MKNIIKQFFFYLLLLSQLILNAKAVDPCPLAILVTDLSTSGAEFKIIVKDSDGFNAWLVLNKEAPLLRTNLDELRLVSKNLDEINKAGGYLKWKDVLKQESLSNTFKNITKLALNSDNLGKLAINYRKSNNLWHDGNIAVFEYLDNSGEVKTLVQTTVLGSGRHAERLAIEALEAQNIPLKNIKKIYSELELCELESGGVGAGGCKKMVLDKIGPNVEIIYSYPYPGVGNDANAKIIRQTSIEQRSLDFNKFK